MDYPDNAPVVGDDKKVTTPWNHWFQRVQNVVLAAYSSGPTANRPTKLLWIGRFFFDTTLGRPVYVSAVSPSVVWADPAQALSGTTAARPTGSLYVGLPYFDTTLGKPVWVKTVSPVAWVDATGAAV